MAQSAIPPIKKSEFFAIIAPGFYLIVLGVISYCVAFVGEKTFATSLKFLRNEYWPVAFGVIIFSYLIGSILRSIPVNAIKPMDCNIFKYYWKMRKNDFVNKLYDQEFPYPERLQSGLDKLKKEGIATKYSLPKKLNLTHFEYWKVAICSESPDLFAYTQDYEGRVRLFAGMFWAGLSGLAMAIGGLVIHCVLTKDESLLYIKTSIIMIIISAIVTWSFGSRVRTVRYDESMYVFLSYLKSCI